MAEDEMQLSKPIFENGRYKNPWSTWHMLGTLGAIKFVFFEKNDSNIPSKEDLDITLPILPLNPSTFSTPPCGVRVMWIGHATVLFQFDNVTVLCDPVFSNRIGPSYVKMMKRYRPPSCSVGELPKIDAVVISHNHYDHLDVDSVNDLNERFGDDLTWFVPMGMAEWMKECGVVNVTELTWWESARIKGDHPVEFVCTPCQHWCRRGAFDLNKMLWSSWTIIGPNHRVFFNGDTGYCSAYKEIGHKFGPIDVAAIPIGAYIPRKFLQPQHVDPEEAVQIHKDLQARKSLGMHWGTFPMGREFYLGPREQFAEAAKNHKIDPEDCFTMSHGEVRDIDFGRQP